MRLHAEAVLLECRSMLSGLGYVPVRAFVDLESGVAFAESVRGANSRHALCAVRAYALPAPGCCGGAGDWSFEVCRVGSSGSGGGSNAV